MRQPDEAPLDLDAEPARDEPRRAVPPWLWVLVAAAFVAGGALGLVVADTRDDAAGLSDVRLVSGLVQGSSMTAERVVEASGLADTAGTLGFWEVVCAPPALAFPIHGGAEAEHAAETVTVHVPVANPGAEPLGVLGFGSETAGLALTEPEVPFELPPNEAVHLALTWSVTDCEAALAWPDVMLDYRLERDGDETGGSQLLPGRARAELVLLVQRVCGDAR